MRPEDFAAEQRIYVSRAEGGYYAFVPPALPPLLTFDTELVQTLSEADRALGNLAGAGHNLPNPWLMSQTLMRREAVLSSRIEGTHATLSDLALFEVDREEHRADLEDVREVFNDVAAMAHVLDPHRRLPLSLPLLREAHAILMEEVRGGYATPGEFRRSQNWIGRPGATLNEAIYVPPPPDRMWDCLDSFEKYLHVRHELPLPIVIANLHYQFEAIHPFLDGNGRVGRLLVVLLLIEWGILPAPLLDLSAYLEQHRNEYYARLLAVSRDGDWRGWLMFFFSAIQAQALSAARRAKELMILREDYRRRVMSQRSSSSVHQLVDELFTTPAMTIKRAQGALKVTHRAALANIEKLVRAGVLEEVKSFSRTRFFLAREIIETVGG